MGKNEYSLKDVILGLRSVYLENGTADLDSEFAKSICFSSSWPGVNGRDVELRTTELFLTFINNEVVIEYSGDPDYLQVISWNNNDITSEKIKDYLNIKVAANNLSTYQKYVIDRGINDSKKVILEGNIDKKDRIINFDIFEDEESYVFRKK